MAQPGFTPRHPQPFTLQEAQHLEVDTLLAEAEADDRYDAEIKRLENSLNHLRTTQAELQSFLRDDPEGDDDGEIRKAVDENEVTIASQEERIAMIKIALEGKIGEGAMRHYGVQRIAAPVDQPLSEGAEDGDTEGGMHL